jgi:hypothetical protein
MGDVVTRGRGDWKRDAAVGAIAGTLSLLLSIPILSAASAAIRRPELSSPWVTIAFAALFSLIPGYGVGGEVNGWIIDLTNGKHPGQVMKMAVWLIANAGVYSATWVALRSAGPRARIARVATISLWLVYFLLAAFVMLLGDPIGP